MYRGFALLFYVLIFTTICPLVVFAQRTGINLSGYAVTTEPFPKGEKINYRLTVIHPHSIPLKTIQKSMGSLAYKKQTLFGSKQKRIFKNKIIKAIAPIIKTKLENANMDQLVSFEIFSRSGKKFIQGDTFITTQGLNWRFTIIEWEKWEIDSFNISGEPWELVLQQGHAYKKWFWKKSKRVSKDITNWIIFEDLLPASPNIISQPENSTSDKELKTTSRNKSQSIKNRLLALDALLNEKIISEKEYKMKRKEILNDL
jgi:hypothetical protein